MTAEQSSGSATSPMFRKLLVPVDGSEPAAAATATALRLAREHRAQVVFANAIDVQVVVDLEELAKDESRAVLLKAEQEAAAHGVPASSEILIGRLAPTLTAFARETGAELIIMGTHARTELATILGSETNGVLRAASVPVLTVHSAAASRREPAFSHLFVAVDETDAANAGVLLAARYAAGGRADMTLCTVVDTDLIERNAAVYGFDPAPIVEHAREHAHHILAQAVAGVSDATVRVNQVAIESGDVVAGILDTAGELGADLIVIGSHGRTGLRHFLLGSVSEGVVQRSEIPVLVTHARRP